jgi:hypothetical protein
MTRPSSAPKSQPSAGKPKLPQPSGEPQIALKPRPGLFFTLLAIFLIWIALLVTLYFTTVYEKGDVHVNSSSTTR